MQEINKLSDFGYSFQIKLISILLTDKTYFQQIIDILEPVYFDSTANVEIINMIKEYFLKYKKQPTLDALKITIKKLDDDILRDNIIDNIKESLKYIKNPDLDIVKDETVAFCKNQVLKNAIYKSVDLLEEGKHDEIRAIIDAASKAGMERNLGHEYLISVDERYLESVRTTCATGWEPIDEIMDGGLGPGEMGIIVGGPGSGKSSMLVSIGTAALLAGKVVLHYTMELYEDYTGRKYDSLLMKIPAHNLKYHIDEIKDKIKDIKGNLYIKYFPEKSVSVHNIHAHIEKYKLQGITPDLVIVDYIDLLKQPSNKQDRQDQILSDMYSELRGVAGQLGIPLWSASQSGRNSAESEVVEGHHIADSYMKIAKADFVMSVSRILSDKLANTGRIFIIKNRFGPDGLTYPSKIQLNTGLIEIYDRSTSTGIEQQRKIDNKEDYVTSYLSKRFKEIIKEKE